MEIYSIGHTNNSLEKFFKMIRVNKINCIVDVRSTPFSKFTPQFNQDSLKKSLNKIGIYYIHMGTEFGARRKDKSLYTEDGYLDFEKTRKSAEFIGGICRLEEGCKKGFVISLMCTEKDPFDCHRAIMVSKGLKDNGFIVKHILPNLQIQTQDTIESRLLDRYFPDRFQMSLNINNTNELSQREMLEEAYRKRNKEIGYELGGEENN